MTIVELKAQYPYLGQLAAERYDESHCDNRERGENESVDCAFDWEASEEGYIFWNEVYNQIELNEKELFIKLRYYKVKEEEIKEVQEVEEEKIELSTDYWVVETDTYTYQNIIRVDYIEDNDKMFFDLVQERGDDLIYARLPKARFRGMYKKLKSVE